MEMDSSNRMMEEGDDNNNNLYIYYCCYRIKEYLAPKTKAELKHAVNNYFKFTVVRHPFTRLVSAYRFVK